ncbi:MAG: protein-methionine-sulfoxide reductase heme-binding subunit MsrQ [Maritimibacter sp.]|nr:protein-methionine-sulfoxide reductase heme-binding subunit MsrQ [Maritimibacter sp.]
MALVDTLNGTLRKLPTWPFYVIGLAVPLWYLYLGFTGGLGVEPIKELEHRLGLLGLQVLAAGLLVTPLRRFAGLSLLRFRRMLGLIAFYYICAHLLTWLLLDVRNPSAIWADIVKRPYITIGMIGFLALVPLAVTSNNASIRKLGALGWRRLHMLVYPAVILGAVHFVMLRKGWQVEPLVYLAAFVVLVGLRLIPRSVSLRRSARA